MLLRLVVFLAFAASLFAANSRLYLKDGEYHIVREYKVEGDRVRYFSTERGDWEEIPLELVDLTRTTRDAEVKAKAAAEEIKVEQVEAEAIRADRKLMRSVPEQPGPYLIDESKPEAERLVPLKQAKAIEVESGSRKIIQVISPVAIIPGKATVELEGATAAFHITNHSPEFFFRLMREERFQIIKLPPKGKNARLVENVTIFLKGEEVTEEQKEVPTFKKQLDEKLYKIWPQEPMEAGEYALVEFSEGEINVQVWDFAIDSEYAPFRPKEPESKSGKATKKK